MVQQGYIIQQRHNYLLFDLIEDGDRLRFLEYNFLKYTAYNEIISCQISKEGVRKRGESFLVVNLLESSEYSSLESFP